MLTDYYTLILDPISISSSVLNCYWAEAIYFIFLANLLRPMLRFWIWLAFIIFYETWFPSSSLKFFDVCFWTRLFDCFWEPVAGYYFCERVALWGWFELLFLFICESKFLLSFKKKGCLNTWSSQPFFLNLWKSYIFNCRMKDEKLLCLKYYGKIWSLNKFGFFIWKPSPVGVELTMSLNSWLSTISYILTKNDGTW